MPCRIDLRSDKKMNNDIENPMCIGEYFKDEYIKDSIEARELYIKENHLEAQVVAKALHVSPECIEELEDWLLAAYKLFKREAHGTFSIWIEEYIEHHDWLNYLEWLEIPRLAPANY